MDKDLQSIQEARDLAERAHRACLGFRSYSQAQVDAIVTAMAAAAGQHAERLARMAVEETGYGRAEDKLQKNLFAAQRVFSAIRDLKTIGIVNEKKDEGIIEIATSVGVVAAILPSTNPTSTAIYKILIAIKSGNSIVISPHPSAMRCICETVGIMAQAARAQGAPEDLICCFGQPTMAGTQELMRHRRTSVILATGGMGIVKAAYSSGKPAFGVGPGNVPAFIDRSARLEKAVADVVAGKTFDWGTICSSEQALVAEHALREPVLAELRKQRAQFLSPEEIQKLGRVLILPDSFTVNPRCVGQSPQKLGELSGIAVAPDTRVLIAELPGMGREHPLSAEKLSPVLALYFVQDREAAYQLCRNLLHFGGLGHTCVIHAQDDVVIREYGERMPAFRIVVNSPAPQGSIGATTRLFPAMTLGCGAAGGNITSDNIGPQHLINLKRIAYEQQTDGASAKIPPVTAGASAPAAAACACRQVAVESPAPAQPSSAAVDRGEIRRIVDRFLTEKGLKPPAASNPPALAAPMPSAATDAGVASNAATDRADKPAPATRQPLDFVCEADVRDALRKGTRLAIGPKTLLTPAARDLGQDHNIFDLIAP